MKLQNLINCATSNLQCSPPGQNELAKFILLELDIFGIPCQSQNQVDMMDLNPGTDLTCNQKSILTAMGEKNRCVAQKIGKVFEHGIKLNSVEAISCSHSKLQNIVLSCTDPLTRCMSPNLAQSYLFFKTALVRGIYLGLIDLALPQFRIPRKPKCSRIKVNLPNVMKGDKISRTKMSPKDFIRY